MSDTLLSINGVEIGKGAGRNLNVSLPDLPIGERFRTVNQDLHNNLNPDWVRKYSMQIQGNDINAPVLDGLTIGDTLTITDCPIVLQNRITAGNTTTTLNRTPATGSVTAEDIDGNAVAISSIVGDVVTIPSQASTTIVRYRPTLTMMIDDMQSFGIQEWAGSVSWSLRLLEI